MCSRSVQPDITVSRRTQSGKYALKWKASQTKKPDFLVNDFTKNVRNELAETKELPDDSVDKQGIEEIIPVSEYDEPKK
ncbi:hypothetical protein JL09_g4675 [Pichia kudriavzevii]|uniref:Uncharacterized protein n=1 Tax=Pichia kudriavzevii TaxID=4909 RepID=A0A099NW20_PICKU|nr:hypothetical protein JL09_g4698 [Pichia kudriavzevii]KGK36175.1 hypothetical protein JL09_g4675 [Pichia kudriavzevii]